MHRKVHAEFGGRLPRKRPVAGTSPGSPPYDHFGGISHQLCTAHLLRDIEDAAQTYPEAIWPAQIARELRAHPRRYAARGQGLAAVPDELTAGHLKLFRNGVNAGLSQVRRVPGGSNVKQPPALHLLECLKHREADVLRFLTDTAIPPTSNQANATCAPRKPSRRSAACFALKPPPGTATPSAATHPPPASTELTCSPRSRTPSPETPGYRPSRPSPELHPELITHSYTCVTGTPECLPQKVPSELGR